MTRLSSRRGLAWLLPAALVAASGCTTVRLGPDATGVRPAAAPAAVVEAGRRLFPVRVGTTWGYIDASGAVAVAPRFDDAQAFSEGRAGVRVGAQWGYIDPSGARILTTLVHALAARGGRYGLAAICIGGGEETASIVERTAGAE